MLKRPGWALSALVRIATGLIIYLAASRLLTFTTFTSATRNVVAAAVASVFVGYFLSDLSSRS
jgi:multisubunit Na+/H+ antiporter MnhB subunit